MALRCCACGQLYGACLKMSELGPGVYCRYAEAALQMKSGVSMNSMIQQKVFAAVRTPACTGHVPEPGSCLDVSWARSVPV